MRLTPLEAHAICAGLVAVDLVARAWRIQWLVRGLGCELRFRDAFVLNAFGDAACAVTPLRVGGEPARLGGLLRAGVPAMAGTIAILLEVLWAWPVIIVSAAILAWRYAPHWWETAGAMTVQSLGRAWPVLIIVAVFSVVAWRVGRRLARRIPTRRSPFRRLAVYRRRMPLGPLLASVPLSVVNLATRTAILPVLALSLPEPPPLGPALLGSFALLYSQLLLPTPSGAGAVDVGFVGGIAGDLGGQEKWLLLAWRFYSNGVGVLLGAALAVQAFGWPALRRMLRGEWARARGSESG